MPLAPGSKVGTDSRLDRSVAIKTLPDEFSADPDRLARFEREAKVLAQLNHPHLASIYGIEPGPHVKILDFGLAKAMSSDASGSSMNPVSSPTITSPAPDHESNPTAITAHRTW